MTHWHWERKRPSGERVTEVVMQNVEVSHGKLGVKTHHDAVQEGRRGLCEDDVVNVDEQVGGGITLVEHKEGCAGK